MSTYDAGSVQASADLNKDPFIEGLKQLQRIGDEWAKQTFTASANINTLAARRAIADLDALIQALNKEEIVIKARADTGDAEAELAALRAELAALRAEQDEGERASRRRSQTNSDEAKSFSLMGTAIAALVPLVGPLAGFAVAGAAGFGAMGIAGIGAVMGIRNEMKAGTQDGQVYTSMINGVKAEYSTLTTTLAGSVRIGAQEAFDKILQDGPQLNQMFAGIARQTGDIAQHGVGAILNTMTALHPLVSQFLDDVDRGAAGLERWTAGGGLTGFVTWMQQNLPTIEHDLGDIVKAVGQIITAGAGQGMLILNVLDVFAKDVSWLTEHVPGLVPIITDVYLAMQLYKGLGPAVTMLRAFAAAEAEAGAAGAGAGAAGGLRGLLGGAAGAAADIAPYVAALVGVGLAVNVADKATEKWTYSTNSLQRVMHGTLDNLNQIAHGHIFSVFTNPASGKDEQKFQEYQKNLGQYQATLKAIAAQQAQMKNPGPAAFAAPVITGGKSILDEVNTARIAAYKSGVDSLNTAYRALDATLANTPLSQAAQQWSGLQSAVQANVDQTDKFVKLGGPTMEVYRGITVGQNTYKAALAATNNDQSAAIGLIHGSIDAMDHNRNVINDLVTRQTLLSRYQTDAASKYGLTTQQVDLYSAALGLNADAITNNGAAEANAEAKLAAWVKILQNGSTALNGLVTAIGQFTQAGDTAASRGALIGQVLKAANGDALDYANTMVQAAVANQQMVTDFKNLKSGVLDLKTGTLDYHNAAAAPLLGDLAQMQTAAMNAAAATYQHETALGHAGAADQAFNTYVNDTHGALVAQAGQLGITTGQAGKLADKYFGIKNSGDIKKQIELLGQDKVLTALQGILQDLDLMTGQHHADLTIDATFTPTAKAAQQLLNAGGGFGNFHVVGEAVSAFGNIVQFARGGMREDHSPQIVAAHPGMVRVFAEPETSWEAYIPGANDSRRPRAKAIASETVRRLGGVAHFESGGFTGVDYSKGGPGSSGGGSFKWNGHVYSSLTALHNAQVTAYTSLSKSLPGDLTGLAKVAKGTADQVATAMNKILTAVKQAYSYGVARSSLVTSLTNENKQLMAEVNTRVKLANDLAKAQSNLAAVQKSWHDEAVNVETTVMGQFDIGTSGNGYAGGIMASLDRTLTDTNKFIDLRNQAKSLGLNPQLIQKITEEGPQQAGANLQAIVNGGASYIAQLNAQYGKLIVAANTLGQGQATDEFGKQITALQTQVASDNAAILKEQKLINANIATISKQVTTLESSLTTAKRRAGA